MAMDYCEIETKLANSVADTVSARSRFDGGVAAIVAADNLLGSLAATYGAVVTEIDAQVAAAPTDAAWLALKARKGKIVASFQALKTATAAARAALGK